MVDAADQLGVTLTPEIAAPAFVALATDTGWFRFSLTTRRVVPIARAGCRAAPHDDARRER